MRILVIGVAFSDIKGFPFGAFDPKGTNKGSVVITHGGVSRNVAEDLANLGANVEFLTMLDDSPLGEDVKLRLEAAGVSLQYAVSVPGGGIGMWLAVFDESGNLAGSISKMPDVLPLEKALQDAGDMLVQSADAVVVEYDTSEEIALLSCSLTRKNNKPLYVIVGNMSVMLACPELVAKTRCAIMNEIEAVYGISDRADAMYSAIYWAHLGLKHAKKGVDARMLETIVRQAVVIYRRRKGGAENG